MIHAPRRALRIAAMGKTGLAPTAALERFIGYEGDPLALFIDLVAAMRPRPIHDVETGRRNYAGMVETLRTRDDVREAVRAQLMRLFASRKLVTFFTDTGILPASGFFSELSRRIFQRLLPAAPDERSMRDCLRLIFSDADDYAWLSAIPIEQSHAFWAMMNGGDHVHADAMRKALKEMLDAVQVLSHRVSAMGVEQELLRVYPELDAFESPFLAQTDETHQFVAAYRTALDRREPPAHDAKQLFVLIDQCRDVLKRARRTAAREGTSLRAHVPAVSPVAEPRPADDAGAPAVGTLRGAARPGGADQLDRVLPLRPARGEPAQLAVAACLADAFHARAARHRQRQPHRRALHHHRLARLPRDVALGDGRGLHHRVHGADQDRRLAPRPCADEPGVRLQHELRARLRADPHAAFHHRHQAAGDDGGHHRRHGQRVADPRRPGQARRPDRRRAAQPVRGDPRQRVDRLPDGARAGVRRGIPARASRSSTPRRPSTCSTTSIRSRASPCRTRPSPAYACSSAA